MINKARMEKIAAQYGISLSDDQLDALDIYAGMLVERNEQMNLTAITDPEEVEIKHFLDCLLACRYCGVDGGADVSLVDVGTGAGFPGMVLKIAMPSIRLTLLDSLDKRLGFLQDVCDRLDLDADFVHIRAEDAGQQPEYRARFDIAIARAVAPLNVLAEYCLPLVRVGGRFVSMKGRSAPEETRSAADAIAILGGEISEQADLTLPDGSERSIIVVTKIADTPDRYPRRSPAIKKKPL